MLSGLDWTLPAHQGRLLVGAKRGSLEPMGAGHPPALRSITVNWKQEETAGFDESLPWVAPAFLGRET